MDLGTRIQQRLDILEMSQDDLAKKVGVSQPAINKIINGTTKNPRNLFEIADALKTTATWLKTGKVKLKDQSNVSSGPDTKGYVPLISWVQAGDWAEAEDHYLPGDGEDMLPCIACHGMHSYALRVDGDSMTSSHGKSYPDGCIIFVDPDQAGGVVSGDRVIAKLNGDSKVTFKQFIDDSGRKFLKPLNPQYPIITDEFRIIGKVIGKWEAE